MKIVQWRHLGQLNLVATAFSRLHYAAALYNDARKFTYGWSKNNATGLVIMRDVIRWRFRSIIQIHKVKNNF